MDSSAAISRLIAQAGQRAKLDTLAVALADPSHEQSFFWPALAEPHGQCEIGSITKAVTGVLLADMVLAGEVGLDERLGDLLPWGLRWRDGQDPQGPTLEDLATHRSGLPNTPREVFFGEVKLALGWSGRDPWEEVPAERYRAMVTDEAQRARPGKGRYSSLAFGLLGDALAARAGRPYEALVADRILTPLGMLDSTFSRDTPRLLPGHSARRKPIGYIRDRMPAAGALVSTTGDLTRFLRAGLSSEQRGARHDGHPDAVVPERLHAAFALSQQPRHRMGGKHLSCGLGWLILDGPEGHVVWHNGGTWGFRSFAGVMPALGRSVAVLTNTARTVDRLGMTLLSSPPGQRTATP